MSVNLTPEEARALGCLLEKLMATPEYYPLSLNALVNACNQKVNRSPVVAYDEAIVLSAVESLRGKGLLWANTSGRVVKYKEGLMDSLELPKAEAAVICVLLLRGPQTVGEIRARSERLYCFDGLEGVHGTLETLAAKGFVEQAARLPGQKEQRFHHLFSPVEVEAESVEDSHEPQPSMEQSPDRLDELELKVEALSSELAEFKQLFGEFKQQFE
ncbi:MAG: YceH family protein [Phycisphaeraceae bacterium]|nr:YceH family protein [Phycisphaeraceae bacterium]